MFNVGIHTEVSMFFQHPVKDLAATGAMPKRNSTLCALDVGINN